MSATTGLFCASAGDEPAATLRKALQALRKITSDLALHPRRHEWGSAVCKGCKLVKELRPEHVLSKLFVAEVRRTEKLGGNRTLELGRLFAGVPE